MANIARARTLCVSIIFFDVRWPPGSCQETLARKALQPSPLFSRQRQVLFLPGDDNVPSHKLPQQALGAMASLVSFRLFVVTANYFIAVSCSTSKLSGVSMTWLWAIGTSGSSVSSSRFSANRLKLNRLAASAHVQKSQQYFLLVSVIALSNIRERHYVEMILNGLLSLI